MTITIDGPTASGKSSLGRLLAQRLNYYYIYSGLLYRALAYILIHEYEYTLETIAQPNHDEIKSIIDQMRYEYDPDHREQIWYKGNNITAHLKDAQIDQGASIVSTNPFVRKQIDAWQHTIANEHDVVIDGRDAGTVVFPHADYKFYLTADPKIRATRWRDQQLKKGNAVDHEVALQFITRRDERDTSREHAPLKLAEGGIRIDNSGINLEETLETILKQIKK